MGNTSSGGGASRRRQGSWRTHPPPPPPPQPPRTEIRANSYIFAAATPYPAPYPSPSSGFYQFHPRPPPQAGYYPTPAPYDHHHGHQPVNWAAAGRYPYGPVMPPPAPYVEHQKAVTIRNDVNVKKETLRVEPDEENPGKFLVAFTFDATVSGSITVIYFAKEGEDCKLAPANESLVAPVTVHFERGLGQKFRQPSGTGIDFSMFEESDLLNKGDADVCPLAVKAEACMVNQTETASDENAVPGCTESQITQAVFDKDGEEYKVKVLKQILWVNETRYELQEIYGIGNSEEGERDGNDSLKECVICLSEPRDTTVLPCRHMCLCSECAKVLRFQTNRCPICRQPIERLLEIKVSNGNDEETSSS